MKSAVICCGLSTLDMQLHSCRVPLHLEHITPFSHTTSTPGGSAPQTAYALSSLCISVSAVAAIGNDAQGTSLCAQLQAENVDTTGISVDNSSCTAMAVLPLFEDGRRGCFVTLGANLSATPSSLLPRSLIETLVSSELRVFHFGYPHLMPKLQGDALRSLFDSLRDVAPRTIITLDVNGADCAERDHRVLTPALPAVAVVHANLEEACIITALADASDAPNLTAAHVRPLARWFIDNGAAVACITCGSNGSFIATADSCDDLRRVCLDLSLELSVYLHRPAFCVADSVKVNASGAGDAFTAGVIAELVESAGACGITRLVDSGLASALRRIDPTLVSKRSPIREVLKVATQRGRIPPRRSLLFSHSEQLGEHEEKRL